MAFAPTILVRVVPGTTPATTAWLDVIDLLKGLPEKYFEDFDDAGLQWGVNMPHVIVERRDATADEGRVDHPMAFRQMRVFATGSDNTFPASLLDPWVVTCREEKQFITSAIVQLCKRAWSCVRLAAVVPRAAAFVKASNGTDASATANDAQRRLFAKLWNKDCAMLSNPYTRYVRFSNETGKKLDDKTEFPWTDFNPSSTRMQVSVVTRGGGDDHPSILLDTHVAVSSKLVAQVSLQGSDLDRAVREGMRRLKGTLPQVLWPANAPLAATTNEQAVDKLFDLINTNGGISSEELRNRIKTAV